MSDGIWYNNECLGSVHYFVYKKGQLPGDPNGLYVRLHDFDDLERILQASQEETLRVGEKNMTIEEFKEKILGKTGHIGFLDVLSPLHKEYRPFL